MVNAVSPETVEQILVDSNKWRGFSLKDLRPISAQTDLVLSPPWISRRSDLQVLLDHLVAAFPADSSALIAPKRRQIADGPPPGRRHRRRSGGDECPRCAGEEVIRFEAFARRGIDPLTADARSIFGQRDSAVASAFRRTSFRAAEAGRYLAFAAAA